MRIEELRSMPELAGLDDRRIVEVLRSGFYPDLDEQTIASAIGVKLPAPAPAPLPPKSMGESAVDTGVALASGITSGVGMIASAFGADNPVAKATDAATKWVEGFESPARKAQKQQRAQIIKEAEASGSTWEEIKAYLGAFKDAPLDTVVNAVGTSAPTILSAFIPGLGQANAARLIAMGAMGATQGAGAVKGQIYDSVKRGLMEKGYSQDDAEKVAAGAQAYDGENAGTIAAGAGLGAAAGMTGAEAILAKLASGKVAAGAQRGVLARAGTGALKEAPVEGAQGAQERYASNVAQQRVGLDVPTWQGVAGQGALEAAASAPMGGAFGIAERARPTPADVVAAPTVEDAVAVAQESLITPQVMKAPEVVAPQASAMADAAAKVSTTPAVDPFLERLKALPETVRGEALAAYDLLQRDDLPKGVRQYNSRLLDDLILENKPSAPPAGETSTGQTGASLLNSQASDPLMGAIQEQRDTATAQENLNRWMQRAQPIPLDRAQEMAATGREQGLDLEIVPHSSGSGYTIVPGAWITPQMRNQVPTTSALLPGNEPTGILRATAAGQVAPETVAQAAGTNQVVAEARAEQERKAEIGLTPDVERVQAKLTQPATQPVEGAPVAQDRQQAAPVDTRAAIQSTPVANPAPAVSTVGQAPSRPSEPLPAAVEGQEFRYLGKAGQGMTRSEAALDATLRTMRAQKLGQAMEFQAVEHGNPQLEKAWSVVGRPTQEMPVPAERPQPKRPVRRKAEAPQPETRELPGIEPAERTTAERVDATNTSEKRVEKSDETVQVRDEKPAEQPRDAETGRFLEKRDHVKDVVDTMRQYGMDLKIADTVDDLPDSGKKRIQSEGIKGVRGMFDPDTGTTWIVRENIRNPEEAFFVALHEAFHRGMVRSFGEKAGQILDYLYLNNRNLREQTKKYQERYGISRREAIEEVLADMAGEGKASDLKGWDRLVAFLKDAIAKIAKGLNVNIQVTDAMVEQFVAGVRAAGVREAQLIEAPKDQTQTEAFKRWFGDSKVVDADGRPLVVYHGTDDEISSFDRGIAYFSDDADGAGRYGSNVMSVYLSIKNPYVYDDTLFNPSPEFIAELKDKGHDGIISAGEDENERYFIAFRPEQIKSATGNRGTFDPSNPDIRFSQGTRSAIDELSKADELFAIPKSDGKTLEEVAADIAPEFIVRKVHGPGPKSWKIINKTGDEATLTIREPANTLRSYGVIEGDGEIRMVDEPPGVNPEDAPIQPELYIDISKFKSGREGSLVYAMAADLAYNTGARFIGDPQTLSDAAMFRRLEQMISTAIKHGTTEHIAPHARQVEGDKRLGVPPLKWVYGDHEGNIERMIDVSRQALAKAFPSSKLIEYRDGHFYRSDTGERFRNREQLALMVGRALAKRRGVDGGNGSTGYAGWRTVARNALFGYLQASANGEPGTRGRLLEGLRAERARVGRDPDTGGAYEAKDRILYSRGPVDESSPPADRLMSAIAVDNVRKHLDYKFTDYRSLALGALGRRQIADLYAKDLPELNAYSRLVQQMDAEKNENGAEADELARSWAKLKDERPLAELMHDSTLKQIDPAKPYVPGDSRQEYDELRKRWDSLSPEAKATYTKARDMYEEHYAQVREAIRDRIERAEISSKQKADLLEKMDGEFFDKIRGVYFPLARFGQYVVVVKDSEGKAVSVSRAETMAEAEQQRKRLGVYYPQSKGYRVGKVLKAAEFNASRDSVGRGFMKGLFEVLEKEGVADELQDAVNQLYLSSLPDLSWAKHGIHRKGTPGFSQDARRAFAQNMFHGARYLAKLRYADQLQKMLDDMQKRVKDSEESADFDSVKAQQVVDEMVKRHELLMNPKSNALSTALTSVGFIFHMGLSPASAMVNLTQTPLVTYPIMGAKWGYGKASKALMEASRLTVANNNDLRTVLKGDELRAVDDAIKAGAIDVTMAHDLAGIAQGEDAKVAWKMRPVMRAASFMFHHAERFNRQATFLAAYRLARERGASHEAAYEQATDITYQTHYDYSAGNRPRFMQGNVAKVLLLFKSFAQNTAYLWWRQAQIAMKGMTPQERSEARKALAGLVVSHAMGAGVLGLPMVGTLLALASWIGSDDDEPWNAEVALRNMLAESIGQKPAEIVARGISRATPWDISGRVGLDKLILPDVQEGLEGTRLAESIMSSALGPVFGIGINVARGAQSIGDGHWTRGLEEMMPSALRGPLKAIRYANEGALDKTGVPIKEEVSAAGIAGQALGLSPSEVRNAQEGKTAILNADKRIEERRRNLLQQWSQAKMMGDTEAAQEVQAEIKRFNEKQPQRKITLANQMTSLKNRQKWIKESERGVFLPKSRRAAMAAGAFAEMDDEE